MNGTAAHSPAKLTGAPLSRNILRRLRAFARRLVEQVAGGLSRQAINRRILYQLGGMSDRELRDIGLIRQDVVDAIALAPDGDAASFLIVRQNERRQDRRRGC